MKYQTLQDLFDARINASVIWHAPEGFGWYIGDSYRGFTAEGFTPTFEEAAGELIAIANVQYPDGGPSQQIAEKTCEEERAEITRQ